MAARRQLQRSAFDDGNAVFGVVVAVAGADVRLSPVHAAPTFVNALRDCELIDLAERRVEIVCRRPPPPSLTANLPLPSCTSRPPGFLSRGADIECHLSGRALNRPCGNSFVMMLTRPPMAFAP